MHTDLPAAPASSSTSLILGFAAAVTEFGDGWRKGAGSLALCRASAGSPEYLRARAVLMSAGGLRPDQHDYWVMRSRRQA